MFTVALLMTLTTGVNAPGCHRGGYSYGGYSHAGYGGYCGYSFAGYGGYGHGGYGGYSHAGYGGYCGYSYGGYGGYSYGGHGYGGYGGHGYSYPVSSYSSYPVSSYSSSYACGSFPVYGAAGGYTYSPTAYGRAPDETEEEFAFCQDKAKDMAPEVYANFRNSVWLPMTHEQRQKMMQGERGQKGQKGRKSVEDDDGQQVSAPTLLPAQIVVTLPADARLTIEGEGTEASGTRRVFVSPPLQPNRSYSYTFKAEFQRDGKSVSVTRKVAVAAGEEVQVSFDDVAAQGLASR